MRRRHANGLATAADGLVIPSSFLAFMGLLLAALLEELGHQCRPARLMAGTKASAVVAVKIFIKQHEVTPVWVLLKLRCPPVHGPASVRTTEKETGQPPRQLFCHLPESRLTLGAGRQGNQQAITIKVVQLLQRLNEQVIDWEPDRPTPVGIPAEQRGAGLSRLVVHTVGGAVHREDIRLRLMKPGEGSNAIGRQEFCLVQHITQHLWELRCAS